MWSIFPCFKNGVQFAVIPSCFSSAWPCFLPSPSLPNWTPHPRTLHVAQTQVQTSRAIKVTCRLKHREAIPEIYSYTDSVYIITFSYTLIYSTHHSNAISQFAKLMPDVLSYIKIKLKMHLYIDMNIFFTSIRMTTLFTFSICCQMLQY